MILIISSSICSLAAILVRQLGIYNLYFYCGVCEVPYVPYQTQNKWQSIKMSHFGWLIGK